MIKNKHGNNKEGLGIIDLIQLARKHPIKYEVAIWAINIGFISLAKKILDIK